MKIHKDCKVEAIASSDASRYAIGEPYLDITDGKGTLVSTNGFALAMVPVEVMPDDVAGYVSEAALKAARKQARRNEPASVSLNGVATLADGTTLPRHGTAPADAHYPNWRQVVPKDYAPAALEVMIDAELLLALAQAMGAPNSITLSFKDANSPILVRPGAVCAEKDARGVLMPRRTI